jgi:co-chaperonin GroES (HSP10)
VLEKWEGIEFKLDHRDYLLVEEGGVLGVVEPEQPSS